MSQNLVSTRIKNSYKFSFSLSHNLKTVHKNYQKRIEIFYHKKYKIFKKYDLINQKDYSYFKQYEIIKSLNKMNYLIENGEKNILEEI